MLKHVEVSHLLYGVLILQKKCTQPLLNSSRTSFCRLPCRPLALHLLDTAHTAQHHDMDTGEEALKILPFSLGISTYQLLVLAPPHCTIIPLLVLRTIASTEKGLRPPTFLHFLSMPRRHRHPATLDHRVRDRVHLNAEHISLKS